MNIVHLLSQTQLTGAESHALLLAGLQIEQKHKVTVISNKIHSQTIAKFIPKEIHTNKTLTRIQNIFFLRRFIDDNNIHIIHAHSRAAVRVGFWACLGKKCALVSTVHGRQHYSFSKRLFDLYGTKVIAICENIKDHLIHDFSMNPRKVFNIGNPIEDEQLSFQNHLSPEKNIALIGRTTGPKGQKTSELICEVLPKLLELKIVNKIHIIGGEVENLSRTAQDKLAELSKKYPKQIEFLGHVQNLDYQLKNYCLIIGAGRVAMSAILSGIPTLSIGEYCCEGMAELSNIDTQIKSNFGDIGPDIKTLSLNFEQIFNQLKNSILNPSTEKQRLELKNKLLQYFSATLVNKQIFKIYQSAYFIKNHPKTIPVLMYHKIPDEALDTPHRIFVTKDNFDRQLETISKAGYSTITFQDLVNVKNEIKDISSLPKKPIILTFDDGYQNNLTNALPLLKKYDMKAVIYLLADTVLTTNSWDLKQAPQLALMNKNERQELAKSGVFEIGSHGFQHKKITEMNSEEAFAELSNSKKALENEFNQPILSFAYTYGATNENAARLAQIAGYEYGINTDTGGLHIEENPYTVFRVSIFPEDGPKEIRKKICSWYRRYYFIKRGK